MMDWIDIRELKPDYEKMILVFDEYMGRSVASRKEDKEWDIFIPYPTSHESCAMPKVTHWMPLPEIPEKIYSIKLKEKEMEDCIDNLEQCLTEGFLTTEDPAYNVLRKMKFLVAEEAS